MSSKTAAPVVVTPEGDAAKATPVKGGGLVLSPLPLSGGRKSRKGARRSRKISKKALKAIKKIGGEEVVEAVEKAMGGAEEPAVEEVAVATEAVEGARRRKSKKAGRRHSKKSRKSIY